MFGLVSLFNGTSIFEGYLILKPSLQKKSSGTIKPISVDKEVHTFSKDISPKENVIAKLELQLTYRNLAIQHNHYTTRTSCH